MAGWQTWVNLMGLLVYVVKTSETQNTFSLWYGSSPYWLVRKASFLLMETESLARKQTCRMYSKIACLILSKLAVGSESCAISRCPIALKVIVKTMNLGLNILYILQSCICWCTVIFWERSSVQLVDKGRLSVPVHLECSGALAKALLMSWSEVSGLWCVESGSSFQKCWWAVPIFPAPPLLVGGSWLRETTD